MGSEISILSFNVRCVWDDVDGVNSFIHRAGMIYEKLEQEKPDVVGFQEIKGPILGYLKRIMPEYIFLGHGRTANYSIEGVFTAVRKDSFDIIGTETIWLSPTPYIAGSRFENQSQCPRTCLMTQLRHKESGKLLRVYNIHLDHISDEARVLGMECAFKFVDEYNEKLKLPAVILGDFNAYPDSKTMELCNNRADLKEVTADIPVTFHAFGKRATKIDYIYMSNELADNIKSVEPWKDEANGITLSDHYPICAKVEL